MSAKNITLELLQYPTVMLFSCFTDRVNGEFGKTITNCHQMMSLLITGHLTTSGEVRS